MKRKGIKSIIFYVVLIAVLIAVCAMIFRQPASDELNYDDILRIIKSGEIKSVTFNENNNG
jgi:hypothetical protein